MKCTNPPWKKSVVPGAQRRPETLQEIFFLPEDFHLPALPMKSYVDVHAPFYPRFDRAQFREALEELEVPFGEHLGRISYGQKKKFLIAFGLATGARLLLLDEPTNGLDIPAKSRLRRLLIGHLREDRCFLVSTHQVRDLAAILDPVVILDGGRILLHRDMATISSRIACRVVPEEPVTGDALWYERVPGGFAVLEHNRTGSEGNVDVEMLFNATIQRGGDLLPLLAEENAR